jgi:hypothetical protein
VGEEQSVLNSIFHVTTMTRKNCDLEPGTAADLTVETKAEGRKLMVEETSNPPVLPTRNIEATDLINLWQYFQDKADSLQNGNGRLTHGS